MLLHKTVVQLSLISGVVTAKAIQHDFPTRSQRIEWGECQLDDNYNPPALKMKCGKLAVPLDYTQSNSSETLYLDLIKAPAPNGPSKGSILLNFGGPGEEGVKNMVNYVGNMLKGSGGKFDLIAFDPRGTANTIPVKCWDLDSAEARLGSTFSNASDVAPGRMWAEGAVQSNVCYQNNNATGELIGMSFVARDMMQIVDALDEDGLLRYWGISGGTILGATAAALFPERIDKLIIDGVVNSHQYYRGLETEQVDNIPGVFEGFVQGCFERPDNCNLTKDFNSADDLRAGIIELLDDVKNNPVTWNNTIIDYSSLTGLFLSTFTNPSTFPLFSEVIHRLFQGNTKPIVLYAKFFQGTVNNRAQALLGIRCGDKQVRLSNATDLTPVYEEIGRRGGIFGDAVSAMFPPCAQWKMSAKERYMGDFSEAKTKNPVLLISGRFDPVTPLASAKNMSASLPNNVLLQQNGYGHIFFNQPSECTFRAIQKYLIEGEAPEAGTVCEPDVQLFDPSLNKELMDKLYEKIIG